MSATVHALPTANIIRRADLPPLKHVTMSAFESKNCDCRFMFECPDPKQPDLFRTVMVEWSDGLALYFDVLGTHAFMHYVNDQGFHPADVLNEIRADEGEGWTGVYRVID